MVGKVLAQYRITEKLGEGGMGIVWKARDTHLDRFVALKILPLDKVSDPERKRRFLQEAKAASALNHPNIVHIYDISEADGVQFIAMEYIPGKTLGELIGRKGLRVNDVFRYALQIAGALDKAHSAGIIHRDLKPSNLMVASDGLVKVLDFGLAKLTEPTQGDSAETRTLRAGTPDTEEGVVLGTAAYMSPEQAEGKAIDARSDIFSFGAVLYEMVSGRRAFHGDSKLSTLSAILKEEPEPLPREIPRDLEKIIMRCLRKDPGRRFQHADDLNLALLELKEESDSGKLTAPAATGASVRGKRIWWMAALAVVLIAAGLGIWVALRKAVAPRPAPKLVPLTSYRGRQQSPALSPDGKQVAFSWDGESGGNFDIYVKLVAGGSPLRLTRDPADEDFPAWAPDGSHIAFLRLSGATASIVVMPSLGGAERKVAEVAIVPQYFSGTSSLAWSPDGNFLAVTDQVANESVSIFLISLESGQKHQITWPPRGYDGDGFPTFSPDGKIMAFARTHSVFTDEIFTVQLSSGGPAGEPRRITSGNDQILGLDWTSDGRSIVYSSFNGGARALRIVRVAGGKPEPLTGSGENAVLPSISRQGNRLVYTRWVPDYNIWRIPGPRSSQRMIATQRWIASTEMDIEPQYSPDGKRIVFSSNRSGTLELWTCNSDGTEPVQLTSFGGSAPGSPRWSPDGRWIAFDAPQSGNPQIFVIGADGGAPRQVTAGAANHIRPSWSVDGKWILFGSNRGGSWQVWKIPVQGGDEQQLTQQGGYEAYALPDGELIYYVKSQGSGIWSTPVAGGAETRLIEKGTIAIWAMARDGIAYFDWKNPMHTHPLLMFYSFHTRRSTTLYEFPAGTILDENSSALSVSPDERWILYTQIDQVGSNLMLMENFQ